jgi:hypothetical protein
MSKTDFRVSLWLYRMANQFNFFKVGSLPDVLDEWVGVECHNIANNQLI